MPAPVTSYTGSDSLQLYVNLQKKLSRISVANFNAGKALSVGAGAGITGGTGTVYKQSLEKAGGINTARIILDLTGLSSSTTDLDVIGQSTTPAYLCQVKAAELGTVLIVKMQCLEAASPTSTCIPRPRPPASLTTGSRP
jgi:hypothetical protein